MASSRCASSKSEPGTWSGSRRCATCFTCPAHRRGRTRPRDRNRASRRRAGPVPATPTICLLGDVMLGRNVAETLAAAPAAELWSAGVREACAACDALVVNLECCVSTRGAPTPLIPGKPFFFRAPPSGVKALRAIGASVAGLANNHALDFGVEALTDTLEHLRAGGIVPVGAGAEIDSARRGVVVAAGRLRLGVL